MAKVKQLREHGVQYLACYFDFAGMERMKVLKATGLIPKEVMPRLG
ncbi:MAG: hypothetical protein J4N89_01805 [Chloroflexi bacterium]|nr:hypothetical protein [Chloroflexota bacterium]